jgi:hypothetical protein
MRLVVLPALEVQHGRLKVVHQSWRRLPLRGQVLIQPEACEDGPVRLRFFPTHTSLIMISSTLLTTGSDTAPPDEFLASSTTATT